MAATDLELLRRSPVQLVARVDETEELIRQELQTRSSTVLVDGLRQCTMGRTIIAVGMIGTFEATLANLFGWADPWRRLSEVLALKKRSDLYQSVRDFYDAVNVLKHGRGTSYDRLLARRHDLSFDVKGHDQAFFEEGDVSEVARLVAADTDFIELCSCIIGNVAELLEAAE